MRLLFKLFELRMPEVQLGGGGSGVSVVVGLLLAGEPGVAAARVTAVAAAKPAHITRLSNWNLEDKFLCEVWCTAFMAKFVYCFACMNIGGVILHLAIIANRKGNKTF